MHVAAIRGLLPVIQHLILKGVDLNIKGFKSRTALQCACEYKHTDVAIALVEAEAHIDVADEVGKAVCAHSCNSIFSIRISDTV